MLMISSSFSCSSIVAAAQQSSTTTTLKLSSARERTVEETHWSVKMPETTMFLTPMLCSTRRMFVPAIALSVVLVKVISPSAGVSSGTI